MQQRRPDYCNRRNPAARRLLSNRGGRIGREPCSHSATTISGLIPAALQRAVRAPQPSLPAPSASSKRRRAARSAPGGADTKGGSVRPRQGSGLVLRAIAFGRSSRRAHATGVIQSSPIWRSGCQGVGVDGHCVVGCVVDGVRLAGRSGELGFATVVMLIFGGWPKTFVRRTSAVYCRARPPRWSGCSGDESRSCCARAGPPRAASPAARKCQTELSA